ncbi:hypothetical protein GW17_00048534 [Ensete ventricosum]|nr:hypothetical protein GW17_00048534 [Ensete ventricosum]
MTWHEGPVTLTRGDGSASFATTAPPVLRLCLGSRDARDDASSNGRDSVPFGRICPPQVGSILISAGCTSIKAQRTRIPHRGTDAYDFIFIGGEVACTLDLTSAVTSGIVESYNGLVIAEVWGEGMTRHAALMARGGGVGLARCPDPSTSDADVTVDLAAKLEHTQLHLRC